MGNDEKAKRLITYKGQPVTCERPSGCNKKAEDYCNTCHRSLCQEHYVFHDDYWGAIGDGPMDPTDYMGSYGRFQSVERKSREGQQMAMAKTGVMGGLVYDDGKLLDDNTKNKDVAKFKSGAVRSEKAPPWYMMPWEAVRVVLERFNIGAYKKDYGVHNWKRAIGTGDLEFIRQLFDHMMTHLVLFLCNIGTWHVDREGKHANETPLDHLGAAGWGILTLITYVLYDRESVQKAFNQWPNYPNFEGRDGQHEFELRDNQWTPMGHPEPPTNELVEGMGRQ